MATFDTYFYGGNNLGLRTCPFNPNHKVKDSKYQKHLLKCEQNFPKRATLKQSLNSSSQVVFPSNDSLFTVSTEGTDTLQSTDHSDDWRQSTVTIDSNELNDVNDAQVANDSAIEITENCAESQVEVKKINKSQTDSEPKKYLIASPGPTRTDGPTHDNNEVVNRPTKRLTECIISSKQMVGSDDSQEKCNQLNGCQTEDLNDWERDNACPYSLIDESIDYNNLTDEQIMEMAESFVDVVVLARMTKAQRKRFNEKLVVLKKAKRDRKLKAFNELVTFRDTFDPDLNDIPEEIRKPKVDIRQIFNLTKKLNNKNNCLRAQLSNLSLDESQSNPLQPKDNCESELKSNTSSESCGLKADCEGINGLVTDCICCSQSFTLNETNIRRMTVFCPKCSGTKFGGYFECHSCKLYGYFAKSQITEHMAKHFAKTD